MSLTVLSAAESKTTALERATQDWLSDRRAAGCTPATIYGYTQAMKVLLEYATAEGLESPEDFTPAFFSAMQNDLLTRERRGSQGGGVTLSRHTVHSYLRPMRVFIKWVADEDDGLGIKVRGRIKPPPLPKRHVDVLKPKEIEAMVDVARDPRDIAILHVLAQTGVRNDELCKLRLGDLIQDGPRTWLRVAGKSDGGGAKGDKERRIPLSRPLVVELQAYVRRNRPKDATSDFLFLALRRDKRTGQHEPLTVTGIDQLIAKLHVMAGIERNITPHTFRHTFATRCLEKNMELHLLAMLMGHTTTLVIQRTYAHVIPQNTNVAEQLSRIMLGE